MTEATHQTHLLWQPPLWRLLATLRPPFDNNTCMAGKGAISHAKEYDGSKDPRRVVIYSSIGRGVIMLYIS